MYTTMNGPGEILTGIAAQYQQKVALVTAARTMTFAELDAASSSVAAALHARGIRPGQVVSLYAQNRWEWLVAYHGILKSGAVVNPVNVMLIPDEVEYVLKDCRAAGIFVGESQVAAVVDVVANLPHECKVFTFGPPTSGAVPFQELLDETNPAPFFSPKPDEPCSIGYTSGTTGHPKGAVQSHEAVLRNCGLTATMHGRTSRDVVLTALPAPHVYGNVVINSTWMVGGTVVLMERFSPSEALRLIGEHGATMFEGVPAMYAAMLADPAIGDANLGSLTRCTVGGQTVSTTTIDKWEQRSNAPLIELWGMTELSGLGATHPLHMRGPRGSIGIPLPGVEARIRSLSDSTKNAKPGEAGELQIRGPIVMLAYLGNPQATDEALDAEGWLSTGDVAHMDDAGYLFIVDRLKDLIITGGYNVYPAEIERVLSAHPDVAMVAVGAVPDSIKGELACAYVVRTSGATIAEDDLITFSAHHLAPYKRPRMVRFVDDLPKTSSGKIMRRKLIEVFNTAS
jgi:long-chain acyl-CoA synthetase